MLARLSIALCLLAAPGAAEEHGLDDADLAGVIEGCLDRGGGSACIGTGSAACLAVSGAEGPCLGAEAAFWEARAGAAMAALADAGTEAEAFAAQVSWPAPRPSLAQVEDRFASYRDAVCDMAGALRGNDAGAGEAWIDCRMRVAAEHAMRLDGWRGDLR